MAAVSFPSCEVAELPDRAPLLAGPVHAQLPEGSAGAAAHLREAWGALCPGELGGKPEEPSREAHTVDELRSHHLETIAFVGIYVGKSTPKPGSLRWCEMDFATIHSGQMTENPLASEPEVLGWARKPTPECFPFRHPRVSEPPANSTPA